MKQRALLSSTWASILCAFGAVFFLANFSSTSVQSEQEPRISFEAIVDGDLVKDFTISGLYERIPFYKIPLGKVRPQANTVFLDLDDIVRISLPPGDPIRKFDGREYVELAVLTKGATMPVPLLVERERKVYCRWVTPGGLLKKELLFEAIGTIEIKGFKRREEMPAKQVEEPVKESQAKKALCATAKSDIEKLEKGTPKGPMTEVVASVKKTIHYLCG